MARLSSVSKAIRSRLWDNCPVGLSKDAIRFPNMDIPHPAGAHQLRVFITYVTRERVCVSSKRFRIEANLRLQLISPTDRGLVEHENLLDELRPLFDDNEIQTDGGDWVRFWSAYVQTVGELDNYYHSNIISPIYYDEVT